VALQNGKYDFVRSKEHRFVYEPDIHCSKKDGDAIEAAGKFVSAISAFIKKQNSQMQ
jgi:hypothetical protein